MGGQNSQPQAPIQWGGWQQPSQQLPQAGSQLPNADPNTLQMISNMNAVRNLGGLNTPYQVYSQQHPFLSGLGNAARGFVQGASRGANPMASDFQRNQTELQNTMLGGTMNALALPAQLRMMQAMYGMNPNAQPTLPSSIVPGISNASSQNPLTAQIASARAAGYSDSEIQAYLSGKK